MKLFLRILQFIPYPFLALSVLLWMGTIFSVAFITDFTIENQTGETITVTPVGAVGQLGNRWPLPIVMFEFPSLPSLHRGGYRLEPNESVTVKYDMDDINFSELVIEDKQGRFLQMVIDPNPTINQYHGPLQREYVIGNLAQLPQATPAAIRAAGRAKQQHLGSIVLLSLMFGPWLVLGCVAWSRGRLERQSSLQAEDSTAIALKPEA